MGKLEYCPTTEAVTVILKLWKVVSISAKVTNTPVLKPEMNAGAEMITHPRTSKDQPLLATGLAQETKTSYVEEVGESTSMKCLSSLLHHIKMATVMKTAKREFFQSVLAKVIQLQLILASSSAKDSNTPVLKPKKNAGVEMTFH